MALAFVVVLLVPTISFGKTTKNKKATLATSPMAKAAFLNFPPLPKEITDRFNGAASQPTPTASQRVDGVMGRDWPLVNIGFFQVFSSYVQPIHNNVETCRNKVVVAVVDTGIDYTHPGLRDHVWVNSGEAGNWQPPKEVAALTSCRDKSCNGIDDDGNGFVDDVVGWDFVNDEPLPYDVHGHGTHISGIISSDPVAGVGLVGVCPDVTIMPLKYYDNSGLGNNNLANTVKAIRYAVKMGANIINYSGGGADPAASEKAAIEEAERKGILFVAAAGNDGHSNDQTPYFPASYGLDNIISVASINRENQLLPSSNFGTRMVNIAAPGLMILSSLPTGKFGTMSGTSQATAFVTGTAALLASQFKDSSQFDYRKVKRWILDGSKPMPEQERHMVSNGVLSVARSMELEKEELSHKNIAGKPLAPRNDVAFHPRKSANEIQ